ncbi:hypothetical protein [Chryseobacterium sp. Leaf180]|uniref:hypothetical protein n=1 Tax=Chryseobacterium sp. Leaf180 TaxID=1736289 RepID=UPI000A904C1D|nr:hypothetical protein [Chryseobacterium sp. Leaf180]
MKKILFLFTVITFQLFFSRGQINRFHFSSDGLHCTSLANNLQNTTGGYTSNLTNWVSPPVLSGDPAGNPFI